MEVILLNNKKIKLPTIKKLTLGMPLSLIIIVFCALAVTAADMIFASRSVSLTVTSVMANPLLFVLNLMPVLLLSLLIFFLSGNAVFGAMVSSSVWGIMGIVNMVKTTMRQDPLIPSDLSLFTEVFEIVKGFSPKDIALYTAIFLFAAVIIIGSFLFFKSKKMSVAVRIGFSVVVCLMAFVLNLKVYSSSKIYDSFYVEGNQYFEVNQYASKGFAYSFLYKMHTNKIQKPAGYVKEKLDEFENGYVLSTAEDFDQLPNIIMIMGEAYSDLSENKHFDFSNYTDPTENFKAISQEENAQSGHIVVPNFGGGTSDTEFEVLTGCLKRSLNSSTTAYSLIRKEIDSLPHRLKAIGYDTLAVHPGFSWFYNRANVYNYMGFDNFIHLESFQGEEKYKGGYIADKYATDTLIEQFENHRKESDNPFFEFCVTIENHGPYDEKYNEVEKMFDCDKDLTDKEETLLNSYFMGIRDADIEIKRLTDYFESIDEPVVIVYFGDHLPGFSNGMEFFDKLDYNINANGTDEQVLNVYKTPYLIWQNSVAEEVTDFSKNKDILAPPNNTMNAAFLGAYTLELLGMDNIYPLYSYMDEVRKDLPVITSNRFVLSDGQYTQFLTEEQKDKISLLNQMIYYKMFD